MTKVFFIVTLKSGAGRVWSGLKESGTVYGFFPEGLKEQGIKRPYAIWIWPPPPPLLLSFSLSPHTNTHINSLFKSPGFLNITCFQQKPSEWIITVLTSTQRQELTEQHGILHKYLLPKFSTAHWNNEIGNWHGWSILTGREMLCVGRLMLLLITMSLSI